MFDSRGVLHASSLREVGVHVPQPDRLEQDPEELVASLHAVIVEAVASLGDKADRIVGAGIATQRSSIVCWDRRTGATLSPVISWQDRRAHEWLSRLAAQANEVQRRTGLMLSAHYGASKLRWCLDHLPAVTAGRGWRHKGNLEAP